MEEGKIYERLESNAQSLYGIKAIVQRYMNSVEDVINIPKLIEIFAEQVKRNKIREIMDEIVLQSRVEFS